VSCDDGNGCFKSGGRIDVQQFIVELDVFQPIVQSLQVVLVLLLGTAASTAARSGRRHQANPVVVAAVLLILFRGQQRKVVGYALGSFHCVGGCFVLLLAAKSVERERGRIMMTSTKHPLSLRGWWWKEEEIIFLCCLMMTSSAPEIVRIKVDDMVDRCCCCC